jgi:hypothetical protein
LVPGCAQEDEVPRSITGTPPRRRTTGVAALLIAPATALTMMSGCSAGQVSQTDDMVAPVPGVSVDSADGKVSLRNVMIKYNGPDGYPVGGTAPLIAFVINNEPGSAITLSGATAATKDGKPLGTVTLSGGAADIEGNPPPGQPGATASASARPATSASASASASADASARPSGSAEPSGSAQPVAPPVAPLNLKIPANSFARLSPDFGAYLAITGLTQKLAPGDTAYLTFVVDGKAPIKAPVPFETPFSPPPRATPVDTGENAPPE